MIGQSRLSSAKQSVECSHRRSLPGPPWIAASPRLARASALAAEAHAAQHRPSDDRPFIEHVVEVATLLHDAGLDEKLVAIGLLHDAVERGTLTEDGLRA